MQQKIETAVIVNKKLSHQLLNECWWFM